MTYDQFLRAKAPIAAQCGVPIDQAGIADILKPHQRDSVTWAVHGGRRALFEAFGMGKTLMQLEICRQLHRATGGKTIIVCPLGVRQEFQRDSAKLGMTLRFVRRAADVAEEHPYYLTNYETFRESKLDPALFTVVSLDEASVLRSYGSKTFQTFLAQFTAVPYRFVATATPSPNKYKELIHYAGFLGVMDTGQALTRFFQRDSTQANNLTLYPHKEKEFWLWLSSWALFVQTPSDLGHSDAGYVLPPLSIHYHECATEHGQGGMEKDGQYRLLVDPTANLSEAAREKRRTMLDRIEALRAAIAPSCAAGEQWVIWVNLNDEQKAVEQMLRASGISYTSLYGQQPIEQREQHLQAWLDGLTTVFLSKPQMYGAGVNLQQAHHMAFTGIDYKFYDLIQAVHRQYRFLQEHPVDVHIFHSEAERPIVQTLQHKWAAHKELMSTMQNLIHTHGLNNASLTDALTRTLGIERVVSSSERYTLACNDAVLEAQQQVDASVDLIVTSIPFANHYEYTPQYEDFGHTESNAHFWAQMDYLTPELLRMLKPGRLYCCHTKDRINFGNVTGAGIPTVSPFHAEAIFHALKHGFDYLGMVTVITDVVRENNQTYRLGWSEQCKDGSKMGVGSPEYILLFHKPQSDRSKGFADTPVIKSKADYSRSRWQVDAHAFWRSSGNRLLTAEELLQYNPDVLASLYTQYSLQQTYSYEYHVQLGEALDMRGCLPSTFMTLAPGSHHPQVWTDINRMLTLNTAQAAKRHMLHVCPLQFDIVDRLITRYSNTDELVYDPFCGLGTVPYRAIALGRRGYGSELNHQYWLDSLVYCRSAEQEFTMPTLFDVEALVAEDV